MAYQRDHGDPAVIEDVARWPLQYNPPQDVVSNEYSNFLQCWRCYQIHNRNTEPMKVGKESQAMNLRTFRCF